MSLVPLVKLKELVVALEIEKKQLQAIVNFRVLITELQQRTSARVNYGARIVLGGQSLSLANYTSLVDYEAELLWMFNTMP